MVLSVTIVTSGPSARIWLELTETKVNGIRLSIKLWVVLATVCNAREKTRIYSMNGTCPRIVQTPVKWALIKVFLLVFCYLRNTSSLNHYLILRYSFFCPLKKLFCFVSSCWCTVLAVRSGIRAFFFSDHIEK